MMHRKRQAKANEDEGQANSPVRPMSRFVSGGNSATGTADKEEFPKRAAVGQGASLTKQLMERVVTPANMNKAYQRVVSNKGAAGIDRMTVYELRGWIAEHKDAPLQSLLDGTCQPQIVLGVEIPKPCGGKRQGGIPTVVDRLAQQAMAQALEAILEPHFSDSS